jgi:3-oxoacyl-[acyl-carrier protein] reductase
LKTLVITGGTKGLGRETSIEFGRAGFHVVAIYGSDDAAAAAFQDECLSARLPVRVVKHDLVTHGLADKLSAIECLAHADEIVLIHNATASYEPKPAHLIEWDEFQRQFDVAIKGTFQCAKAVLPIMVKTKRGTIVTVLSEAIVGASPKGFAAYTTAKAALHGLTKSLAAEYSGLGIRIFSVSPGFMDTPLTAAWDERLRKAVAASQPVQPPALVARHILRYVENPEVAGIGENYRMAAASFPQ